MYMGLFYLTTWLYVVRYRFAMCRYEPAFRTYGFIFCM